MEEDHPEKRLDDLVEHVLNAYVFMAALLAELPIPITLPAADPEDWDPVQVLPAIQRARSELILAEPVPERVITLLNRLMLNWLNAYELVGYMLLAGPIAWRLDGVEQEVGDFLRLAAQVARDLQE